MKYYIFILLVIAGLVSNCKVDKSINSIDISSIEEINVPSKEGGESNLFVSDNGRTYLSWVEYLDDTTSALMFSELENNKWIEPKQISSGSDWFVNWADFPSIVTFINDPNIMAAHWLQKSATGTYDYDVHIALSTDGGTNWTKEFIVHRDSIDAEHGFVSMVPLGDDRIFVAWLDGRKTKEDGVENDENKTQKAHSGHAHQGAMSLRGALFDSQGHLSDEIELDNRVCDCCQTSVAVTNKGLIVAYRDRSESEIRDISIVRNVNESWTSPSDVSGDQWEIAGCPVNGPKIIAQQDEVALGWFTAANGEAQINLKLSSDAGQTFSESIRIDDGQPLGRVSLAWGSKNQLYVSWIEKKGEGASLRLQQTRNGEKSGKSVEISEIDPSRRSGFPILVSVGDDLLITWTEIIQDRTRIKSVIIKFENLSM